MLRVEFLIIPRTLDEIVNDFFVNIGPNTEMEIPKVPNVTPSKFLTQRNQFNFLIAFISGSCGYN